MYNAILWLVHTANVSRVIGLFIRLLLTGLSLNLEAVSLVNTNHIH